MSKVYFSCPKFTVKLVMEGAIIVEAAPIVKRFEGQTIRALTSWVQSRFGGPIIVRNLSQENNQVCKNSLTETHRCRSPSPR
jgi:hypothetical protein